MRFIPPSHHHLTQRPCTWICIFPSRVMTVFGNVYFACNASHLRIPGTTLKENIFNLPRFQKAPRLPGIKYLIQAQQFITIRYRINNRHSRKPVHCQTTFLISATYIIRLRYVLLATIRLCRNYKNVLLRLLLRRTLEKNQIVTIIKSNHQKKELPNSRLNAEREINIACIILNIIDKHIGVYFCERTGMSV